MLELATLGLLQKEPLHGYKLKQQLEQFISGCISVNYGAIYPLLKRLEQKGYLDLSITEGEAGGNKKIYAITEAGRERFQEKMQESPKESWVNARSRFMIKFIFFSHISPQKRIKLMEERLAVCKARLKEHKGEPQPDDYYLATACNRYLAVIEDEINWLTQQLNNERSVFTSATTSLR
ncbi:PadR family transcriptional regulator [Euhalothece natronophila Z-M001]|uniref:PadR family transcriptional regulator n=1 Tax=Euhalothece natronophila Z-M001 TaxID=522448 RepID=A0A5B8NQ17_9CHRO|nr:PadR family transcriptional regulator [Euhalothece natronophila]QDZ40299.1 PadR family transcriptional regulator [Euhalothece natronophila Z-M001]